MRLIILLKSLIKKLDIISKFSIIIIKTTLKKSKKFKAILS